MTHRRVVILALFCALLVAAPAHASIGATTGWYVQPSLGNATNGGAFDPALAGAGTNYALNQNKNAAACSNCGSSTINLSTTDAVTNGTTTLTSATANFTAALIGNCNYYQGGSGGIAAVHRCVTAVGSSTSITLDAAIAASTGLTENIGGALDVPATALLYNTTSNGIFVKATAAVAVTASYAVLNNNVSPQTFNRLWGYTSTPGDHGPVTVTLSTTAGVKVIDGSGAAGWWVDGFTIDCGTVATSQGINLTQQSQATHNTVKNCTTALIQTGQLTTISDNELTGCTAACTSGAVQLGSSVVVERNNIHDNASPCLNLGSGTVQHNIFDTCTGASSDGVQGIDTGFSVNFNSFYNIGRDCVFDNGSSGHVNLGVTILGNIFDTCGRYGLNGAGVSIMATPNTDGNAYFASGTANRNNIDNTTYANSYTPTHDIQLTADPYTNAAGANFNLNTTPGGGAAVRGACIPGALPGTPTATGFPDCGAVQSQAAASGGGSHGSVH